MHGQIDITRYKPILINKKLKSHMLLNIPVGEAMELIKNKTRKSISLKVVDSKTINVGPDIKFINADFIVDKIVDTDLYLRYTTGKKMFDVAVNALLSYIGDSEFFNKLEDGGVVLHLDKIEKMNTVLDKITLEDISFDCDSILVKFRPKM